MISHAQSAQKLDELRWGESGWPTFDHQILESSSSIDSHVSGFLTPDGTSFEGFSSSETSSPPAFISHHILDPFRCIDEIMPSHFADPHFHEFPHESRRTTIVPEPIPGKFYSSGRPVNNDHSTLHSLCVSNPLQNAFATLQGSNDIAEIGATICSLIAGHLRQLSGLSIAQEITKPLPARNHPRSPTDTKISGRIHINPQGQKTGHRCGNTPKVADTGFVKHAKDGVKRSHKGRRGVFKCSHPGCTAKALSSRRNLLRHQENVHSSPMVLACGSVQKYRRDNFVRHLQKCQKCQESSS